MTRTLVAILWLVCLTPSPNANCDTNLPSWEPEAPTNIKHDWLKLNSGEWLKGEIITLYNGELEFDSDELGMLTIDWEDIDEVLSYRTKSLRLLSGQIVEGRIRIKDDNLSLSASSLVNIPKSEIVSIAHSTENELDLWTAELTLNLNFREGNTDEQQIGLDGDFTRRTAASRLQSRYVSNYAVHSGNTQENSHRLTADFDWFFSNKAFWRVANYEYYRDPLQNIDSRRTLSTSFGYQFYDTKNLSWSISIGPGTQLTRFVSTNGISNDNERSPSGEFSSDFEWDITRDIEFELDYNLQSVNTDSGRYLHYIKTGIDIDITKRLDLSITLYIDRTTKPQRGSDGTLPKKNDSRLLIGIGYEF